jgi:signal transduction histidine kinase
MKVIRPPGTGALVADGLLAAVVGAFMVVGTWFAGMNQPSRTRPGEFALVLIGLCILSIAGRRVRPLGALALVTGATVIYLVARYPYGPIFFAPVVTLYTVGAALPVRRSAVACGLVFALFVGAEVLTTGAPGSPLPPLSWPLNAPAAVVQNIVWHLWLILAWGVGVVLRAGRETIKHDRQAEARRRAYEERLQIAREVHDVVGHGLAVINMQAGVALHVLDRRPEQARVALDAIKQTSKDALDELRGTLAIFRQGEAGASRGPAPGLDQLPSIVSAMRDSGLPVELVVAGERVTLPATVDLAAFRIVQESLTNVLRHAGPTTAAVHVTYGPREVMLEITDSGRGRAPGDHSASGHGIAGMRERAAAVGGVLEAGPRAGGGFQVSATLPVADGHR